MSLSMGRSFGRQSINRPITRSRLRCSQSVHTSRSLTRINQHSTRQSINQSVNRIPVSRFTAQSQPSTTPSDSPSDTISAEQLSNNLYDVLESRGFINATTADASIIRKHFNKSRTLYAGFDPTADSLHVGNLLILMGLRHAKKLGHTVLCLAGGATGSIGDPSGRSSERSVISRDELDKNMRGIEANIRTIIEPSIQSADQSDNLSTNLSSSERALFLNNASWTQDVTMLDFLREIGVHFRVNSLLSKSSIASRLESGAGISFTEFAYQLLQGFDFYHLHTTYGCTVQLGGADQWGNITSGCELIARKCRRAKSSETQSPSKPTDHTVFGITYPLITTSSGVKFGKSAGNAIWLTSSKTSPYHFYQFWVSTVDNDVERFMKLFTDLSLPEIAEIMQQVPVQDRSKILAAKVTRIVHGQEGLKHAVETTNAMFSTSNNPSNSEVSGVPIVTLKQADVLGQSITALSAKSGISSSKAEIRRLIQNGGLYLNDVRVTDSNQTISPADWSTDNTIKLKSGKKKHYVVKIVD